MHIKQLITDDTNITLQPAYTWGALMVITGLALQVASFVTGKPFDLQSYGIGCGALLALMEGGKKLGQGKTDTDQ